MFSGLPTDNLYKFLAISAIAAGIFFSIFVLNKSADQGKILNISIENSMKFAKEEKDIKKEIITLEAKKSNSEIEKKNLIVLNEYLKKIETYEKLQEVNIKTASSISEVWLDVHRKSRWLFFPLAMIGFGLWYYKIQRHIDREYKNK